MCIYIRSITCLFLAAKSENSFVPIEDFIKFLPNAKITKESVFELELIISRSLRYEYMIHHPYLPAFGFFLDLQVIIIINIYIYTHITCIYFW